MHPLHSRIPPERWGVNREDLRQFKQEVQKLWERKGMLESVWQHASHVAQAARGETDLEEESREVREESIGPSIHDVNEQLIKPRTLKAGGMSWALMLHPKDGLKCDIFVTHCWAEGVFEFYEKVMNMYPWLPFPHGLYICFLANPQNGDIKALLGDDPYLSPFSLALQQCSQFFIVPTERAAIYTRLWCVFEIFRATELGVEICLPTQPRKTGLLLAMLPALGIFACVFLLSVVTALSFIWGMRFDQADHVGIFRYVMWMALPVGALLLCPCILLPSFRTAVTIIVLLGTWLGFRTVWWTDHAHELILPGSLLPNIALVGRGFGYVVKAIIAYELGKESALLNVETVRSANCSSKFDEDRIRAAIKGREDEIDEAIAIVRTVGRYGPGVCFNLDRGMTELRASLGLWPFATVAGTCYWSLCITYLALDESIFEDEDSRRAGATILIYFTMAVSSMMVVLIVWRIGEVCIFFTDVLLWSGVLQYVLQFTTRYIAMTFQLKGVRIAEGLIAILNASISTSCCISFYSGFYALVQRTVSDSADVLSESKFFRVPSGDTDGSSHSRDIGCCFGQERDAGSENMEDEDIEEREKVEEVDDFQMKRLNGLWLSHASGP